MIHTGLIFTDGASGIRLRATRRLDLAVDRLRLRNSADIATIEATAEVALKLRRVLERVFCASGSVFTEAQVEDAINRCRRMGFVCHHRRDIRKPKPIVGWRQPIIQRRRVPDPMMSRAELLHQLEQHPDARWTGYTRADINLSELIGGLARVKRRTEIQTQAAAEFRNLSERAQLGAGKATDYSAVRVDVSAAAGNPVGEIGHDARVKYKRALVRLGDLASLAEGIIVHNQSISEAALAFGLGKGGAARERVTSKLLQATDELAIEFGFVATGSAPGQTGWNERVPNLFEVDGQRVYTSTRATRYVDTAEG